MAGFFSQELLLAEKWARLHKIPFPKVKEKVKSFIGDSLKECYVFKEPYDGEESARCPVVVFFPLVNDRFRTMKTAEIPRMTEEEKSFGDFKIFDDTNAYAIWRFVYPNLSFDRLTAMMEFNVKANLEVVRSEIREIVRRKRALRLGSS